MMQSSFSMAAVMLIASTAAFASPPVRFNQDIRPILSDKCFACHGPDEAARQADLRLDRREDAMDVLSLDDVSQSEILRRVTSTDPDEVMPPPSTHKKITASEANLLKRWISEGAEYQGHWAFLPISSPVPPMVNLEFVQNPIDRFIVARLQASGLEPSPQADRRTLIRRVTLDLTGLPPTPQEVADFLADSNQDDLAYERVVDRLLNSPRYGEHFASEWLDAARYADSDGYESDPLRNMWPWRDWVIDALNRNMPYDQFIIEQLAGDLLPDATLQQKLATGFNRNHRLNNEGGILPEEWQVEYVADRAETTATVFLGLTWGCARCHDHKFDPITQRNYYQLFAFFNNIPESGSASGARNAVPMLDIPRLDLIDEFSLISAQYQPIKAELDRREKSPEFRKNFKDWVESLDNESYRKLPASLRKKPLEKWTKADQNRVRPYYLRQIDDVGREIQQRIAPIQTKYNALKKTGARVMVMAEMEQPRETHILLRGAYDRPGEAVSSATPGWLPPIRNDGPVDRLALARWLVQPNHPLTARVAVNRWWAHYFGTGLVKTAGDFGSQGEPPSHPDLLDWLAIQLIDSDWNVKEFQKLLVMSRTYRQQSSASSRQIRIDPDNRLLSRGARFRLPAAVIRDQALFAGGLLVEEFGGPPVKPYQPESLWKEIIKGGPSYNRDHGAKLYRRSLYTLWRRAVKPPQMMLLDANERDTCAVSLKRTNTPLQALLILNDVTFVEAARGMATRMILRGGTSTDDRISYGMQIAMARMPDSQELMLLTKTFNQFQQYYHEHPEEAKRLIEMGDSPVPPSIEKSDLAAYTALSRVLLNLDETITKP